METKPINLDLKIPQSWSELSDRQLLYVYRLVASNMNGDDIKTLCLFEFSGLKMRHRYGDDRFVVRHHKRDYVVTALQIAELLPSLDWLDEPSPVPVCLSRIGHQKPFAPDFSGVPFEKFIVCDNLFQGYLATQREDILHKMANVLYSYDFKNLSPAQHISLFYWFASVKDMVANMYPDLFSAPASGAIGSSQPTPKQIQESVNAMIRALTKGDISKENIILSLDTHRALTELDAQAKEYHEFNARLKK